MTDIGKLAAFICARNTGDQQCGYVGSTLEDVMHDLSDGTEEASLVLYEGERITGAIILDIYDVGGGRKDIEVWGPYYSAHPEEELRRLFNYLSKAAQAGAIRYVHLFISGDNTALIEYVARYRAEKVSTHYHYSVAMASAPDSSRHMHPGLSVLPVTEPASRWTGQILDLHNQQFQGAILTPEEITAEIEDSSNSEYDVHAVLNGGRFTGYIIVRKNARTGTLHLEYLCIRPEERSRGIGRHLIACLAEKYKLLGYSGISLVVSEENTAAIRFYDKNGFTRDRIMKHILIGGGMF